MQFDGVETVTFQQLIDAGLLEIGDGYRAKNEELGGNGPLFLRAGHVSDETIDFSGVERFHERVASRVAGKMSQHGDVVITTKGNSTGRVIYVRGEYPRFVYSPHLSYWRSSVSAALVPRFLYYWSRSSEFQDQLAAMSASTDMAPYLSLGDQRKLKIRIPPLAVQQEIAAILGSLDDKIECNRLMNRTLEAIARAIFKSWFVDFDPVRAKAGGRKPVGMDPATSALFPGHFEDSELGKIPAGWKVGQVGDLATIHRETLDPAEQPEQLFLHHSIPAFDNGQMPKQEAGKEIKSTKTTVPEGVVLVSKLNPTISRVWLPSRGNDPSICSTEFIVLRPTAERSSREYLHILFSTAEMKSELEQRASGTSNSHQRVRPEDMMQTLCLLPGKRLLQNWTAIVQPMFDRVAHNRGESQTLAALRDTLLPKLISGELRIPDAERLVGRAI